MTGLRWTLTASLLLVAGCTIIAGLDGDYQVGESGGAGQGGNGAQGGASGGSGLTGGGGNPSSGGGGSTSDGGGGIGGTGGVGGVGGVGGTAGAGGAVGCPSGTHQFTAVIADCIRTDATPHDPDDCETLTGQGEMLITTDHPALPGEAYGSFIRFDLSADVAQGPFTSVTLRMVVPNTQFADGPNSGEIWRVQPFVRADLDLTVPTDVGAGAIGAAVGAVAQGMTVNFVLPTTNIVETDSVFLGIHPLNVGTVDYENLNGASPPLLIIQCP